MFIDNKIEETSSSKTILIKVIHQTKFLCEWGVMHAPFGKIKLAHLLEKTLIEKTIIKICGAY